MPLSPWERDSVHRLLEEHQTIVRERDQTIDRLLSATAPSWVKRELMQRLEHERDQADLWAARFKELSVNEGRLPDHPDYVQFPRRPLPEDAFQ